MPRISVLRADGDVHHKEGNPGLGLILAVYVVTNEGKDFSTETTIHLELSHSSSQRHRLIQHSPHPHSLISLFHLGGTQNRCGATYLPIWSHSPDPQRPSYLVHHLLPLPLFLSSFTPRRNALFSSLWASFSTCPVSLSGWGLSHTLAPSKTHAQFVAVGCLKVGLPFYAWCATSGATAAAPGSNPQQTAGSWPRRAAPHAPPRSYL